MKCVALVSGSAVVERHQAAHDGGRGGQPDVGGRSETARCRFRCTRSKYIAMYLFQIWAGPLMVIIVMYMFQIWAGPLMVIIAMYLFQIWAGPLMVIFAM